MPNDTAVSDLVAVMALIAVFVTAAAIAGWRSSPAPRAMRHPR
jgi:hypothetical protein